MLIRLLRCSFLPFLKDTISLNKARFRRIRRKSTTEILTYLVKRSRTAVLHIEDYAEISIGRDHLSDAAFLKKFNLENPELIKTRHSVDRQKMNTAKAELVKRMRERTTPAFFFDTNGKEKLVSLVKESYADSEEETINLADKFLQHHFRLLGNDVTFGPEIDWHFSQSNQRWPLSFSPNIDYLNSRGFGDIKVPWELNRFQHFIILGKAYWYSSNEKYAKEFTDELMSWISGNPYKIGINWMEGIETSIRLISWSWASYFFKDSRYFEKYRFDFLKSVYMQTKFIERHLSKKWQINNNHLIAEASGLIIIGLLFPEFKEAPTWLRKGISLLEKELDKQIVGGFTWEYSTGYHKFVTDFILLATILLKRNKISVPQTILQKLAVMVDFLKAVAEPNGMMPLIGDDDDGRVVKFSESAYGDVRSTIMLGSYLLNDNVYLQTGNNEVFWLVGEKSIKPELFSKQSHGLFTDNGVFVSRSRDMFLLFAAGPQNRKYLHSSHRHLDELSFILEAYGTNFIIDPGTFTYLGDFEWRKYFKSRRSHNAAVIDDTDPVTIEGAFETSSSRTGKICGFTTTNTYDWVAAEYNGYDSVSHIRHVFLIKSEYVLIVDFFEGIGEHTYDLYFHFDSEINVTLNKQDQSVLSKTPTTTLKIVPLSENDLVSEILPGWISHSYGVKDKASVLRFRRNGSSPKIFVTVLFPFKKGHPEEKSAHHIKIDFAKIIERRAADGNLTSKVLECQINFGCQLDKFECSCPETDNNSAVFSEYKRQVLTPALAS